MEKSGYKKIHVELEYLNRVFNSVSACYALTFLDPTVRVTIFENLS